MNSFKLTALTVALGLVLGLASGCSNVNAEHKVAADRVDATYKTESTACDAQTGNRKDLCIAEAKGRQKVALATLDQRYEPSDKNRTALRDAQADATYAVARERCKDLVANQADVCRKEAERVQVQAKSETKLAATTADARTTARDDIRDARVSAQETTQDATETARQDIADANDDVRDTTADARATELRTIDEARMDATEAQRDAAYAVARQKCDSLDGTAKNNCEQQARDQHLSAVTPPTR